MADAMNTPDNKLFSGIAGVRRKESDLLKPAKDVLANRKLDQLDAIKKRLDALNAPTGTNTIPVPTPAEEIQKVVDARVIVLQAAFKLELDQVKLDAAAKQGELIGRIESLASALSGLTKDVGEMRSRLHDFEQRLPTGNTNPGSGSGGRKSQ
jgi:hypothetical protein